MIAAYEAYFFQWLEEPFAEISMKPTQMGVANQARYVVLDVTVSNESRRSLANVGNAITLYMIAPTPVSEDGDTFRTRSAEIVNRRPVEVEVVSSHVDSTSRQSIGYAQFMPSGYKLRPKEVYRALITFILPSNAVWLKADGMFRYEPFGTIFDNEQLSDRFPFFFEYKRLRTNLAIDENGFMQSCKPSRGKGKKKSYIASDTSGEETSSQRPKREWKTQCGYPKIERVTGENADAHELQQIKANKKFDASMRETAWSGSAIYFVWTPKGEVK